MLVDVDVDDTIIEVHGYAKQGSRFVYSGVRGLNAPIATAPTAGSASAIMAQSLRKDPAARGPAPKRWWRTRSKTVDKLQTGGSRKPLLLLGFARA